MNKIKEKIIENHLVKYYRNGKSIHKVRNQVWFSHKRIDIVLVKKHTKKIIAIEIKIHDWKTALRQANLNKIACHESYVAIWHEFSHRALGQKDMFEAHGIGLIIISDVFKPQIEIKPSEPNYINLLAYNYILSSI